MKGLLVTSTRTNAGKSSLGIGLGLALEGIGYFKPLGDRVRNGADEDVRLFKSLFDLPESVEELTVENDYRGILKDTVFAEGVLQELREKYGKVSALHDFVIVESAHNLTYGAYASLSSSHVGSALGIPSLIVCEGSPEETIDKLAFARASFASRKARIAGFLLNKLTDEQEEKKEEVVERAGALGMAFFGAIPASEKLATITVAEIADSLEAEILAGEEGLTNVVEHILVGAMTLDSAIRTLQHLAYRNNAIITGGDRSDIQLLAFESPTSCLILTGNVFPQASVLTKADRAGIPVLFVPQDTVDAAEKVESVTSSLKYGQEEKLSLLQRQVEKHVALDELLGAL